jgi:hypothetical protein
MTTRKAITKIAAAGKQIPKVTLRSTSSWLRFDMTLGGHAADGTVPVRPFQDEPGCPETNPLKDFVDESNASGFIVSWPDSENMRSLSGSILNTLDGIHRDSNDAVRVTSPFFMLDGGGLRMGSMCIMKSPNSSKRLQMEANQDDYHIPGTWLKHYSTLHQ